MVHLNALRGWHQLPGLEVSLMYQNFKEGEEASKPILIRVPLSTEEKLRNEKRRTGESLSLIVATALEFYFTHRGI